MTLRRVAKVGGDFDIRILRIGQKVFYGIYFLILNIRCDGNSLIFMKKFREIIGIQIQSFCHIPHHNFFVKMGEDIILAFIDVRIFFFVLFALCKGNCTLDKYNRYGALPYRNMIPQSNFLPLIYANKH